MKKKETSIPEMTKKIIICFKEYLSENMGMTDAQIDEVVSNFKLEERIIANYEDYSHLNNEQLGDRVLGLY